MRERRLYKDSSKRAGLRGRVWWVSRKTDEIVSDAENRRVTGAWRDRSTVVWSRADREEDGEGGEDRRCRRGFGAAFYRILEFAHAQARLSSECLPQEWR